MNLNKLHVQYHEQKEKDVLKTLLVFLGLDINTSLSESDKVCMSEAKSAKFFNITSS